LLDARRVDLSPVRDLTRAENRLGKRAVRCHVLPQPLLEVGRWLGSQRRAAAIDVSDGLAIDLRRLCRESGVGALLRVDSLPIPREFISLCQKLGESELDLVLGGGEDYSLLFSSPSEVNPPSELHCIPIGELTTGSRVRMRYGETERPLPEAGWDHFTM
jgi:thiamine-monophosphate kinase